MRQYKVEALIYYTKITTDKDHIGMYRRAKTGDELQSVLEGLISDIGSCD